VRIALASAFALLAGGVRPAAAQSTDWSVALCDTVIAYRGLATSWQYPNGLFLEGMWRVYERTGDVRYFNYIKKWADQFVASDGNLNLRGQTLDSLDNMMPGTVLCHLYKTTHDARYWTAAATIRNRITTYPRTADGGLVHNTTVADELWLDGAFMVSIFLVNYGEAFNDPSSYDEAAQQLTIYYSHLRYVKDATTSPITALGWHAWDQNASATWANRTTGLSPEVWCRAVGWFVVACTEVLDRLPADHPRRAQIVTILSELLQGIKAYQDPTTGLWYEVVDKGNNATQWLDNWVEQSSGCMYTYALVKAIDAGYVSASAFRPTAQRGYEGILSNLELRSVTSPAPAHNEVYLYGTCIGTNVGPLVVGDDSYAYYRDRTQSTNDLHGQGAFLFANEVQLSRYTDLRQLVQAERATRDGLSRFETTNRGFTGEGYVNLGGTTASDLEAAFTLPTAATKRLVVRYANGASADFPVQVSVNGTAVGQPLALPATGAWTAWRSRTLDLALPAGATTIRLQSTSGAGTLLLDWLALDTAPPATPTGLIATVVSATRVDLAWTDASTNETGFTVERKSGAGGAFVPIASLPAGSTSFSDASAVAGAANTYRVIAFNGSGNSAGSNEASITTPPAVALFTRSTVVQRGGSLRLAASATGTGALA
jgi:unsaturated rhamnogalacturonyl hydrolase